MADDSVSALSEMVLEAGGMREREICCLKANKFYWNFSFVKIYISYFVIGIIIWSREMIFRNNHITLRTLNCIYIVNIQRFLNWRWFRGKMKKWKNLWFWNENSFAKWWQNKLKTRLCVSQKLYIYTQISVNDALHYGAWKCFCAFSVKRNCENLFIENVLN